MLDYNKRKDGEVKDINDFFNNPEYKSDFMRFAKVADLYIASHFYETGAPIYLPGKMLNLKILI